MSITTLLHLHDELYFYIGKYTCMYPVWITKVLCKMTANPTQQQRPGKRTAIGEKKRRLTSELANTGEETWRERLTSELANTGEETWREREREVGRGGRKQGWRSLVRRGRGEGPKFTKYWLKWTKPGQICKKSGGYIPVPNKISVPDWEKTKEKELKIRCNISKNGVSFELHGTCSCLKVNKVRAKNIHCDSSSPYNIIYFYEEFAWYQHTLRVSNMLWYDSHLSGNTTPHLHNIPYYVFLSTCEWGPMTWQNGNINLLKMDGRQ